MAYQRTGALEKMRATEITVALRVSRNRSQPYTLLVMKLDESYREQALKLYPWICGRCAREFTHKNLRELTVHHRDGNHGNNPPDGSNWELLCVYCHDNEHSRQRDNAGRSAPAGGNEAAGQATHKPFAGL